MKKLLYISLFLFGLVAASCSKQDIVPNPVDAQEIPTWDERSANSVDDSQKYRGLEDVQNDDTIIGDNGDDVSDEGSGEIVDPENDEDGEKISEP